MPRLLRVLSSLLCLACPAAAQEPPAPPTPAQLDQARAAVYQAQLTACQNDLVTVLAQYRQAQGVLQHCQTGTGANPPPLVAPPDIAVPQASGPPRTGQE